MGRIRVFGLVALAVLAVGAGTASASQVVTFWEFEPEVAGGHGLQLIPNGSLIFLAGSELKINTSRGLTDCSAMPPSLATTLLSNQQQTDELSVDWGLTPESCGSGPASAKVLLQRLPWHLTVSANHTATLAGASIALAFAGGPTCLYRAPSVSGRSFTDGGLLSLSALLLLAPPRQAGCSTWATLHADFGGIVADAPYAFATIENAPATP